MKHEALFSSKDKSKKKLVSSAAKVYLALKGLITKLPYIRTLCHIKENICHWIIKDATGAGLINFPAVSKSPLSSIRY